MGDDLKERLAEALSNVFFEPSPAPHRRTDPPEDDHERDRRSVKRQVKRWVSLVYNIGVLIAILIAIFQQIFGTTKMKEVLDFKGGTDRAVLDGLNRLVGVPSDLDGIKTNIDALNLKMVKVENAIKNMNSRQESSDALAENRNEQTLSSFRSLNQTIQEKLKKR